MGSDILGRKATRGTIAPRVGDLRQVASVRRIALDDGTEKGVRALAFSTGGGLDFWVLADRSLDIGPCWHCGTPIAWQGPGGFRSPALHDAADEGGTGFNRSLCGLLVTGGLDHVRQPNRGKPLHGRLPFTPARVLAYGEDWSSDEPVLFCEGEVTQARYGGEALRLHRRIEAPIGGSTLRIKDRVENLLSEPQPHEILYHFNLGFPAIDEGTVVRVGDGVLAGPMTGPDKTGPSVDCHRMPSAVPCFVTTPVAGTGDELRISFQFDTEQLPFLQVWQDMRAHRYVLGIEPCSSGRRDDGTSAESAPLTGGAARDYHLTLSVSRMEKRDDFVIRDRITVTSGEPAASGK
jgi:hypothetical protein